MELNFQFTEGEGTKVVATEKVIIDLSDFALKALVVNAIADNLGPRSMKPFKVAGKDLYLALVTDDKNQAVFTNVENM